MSETHAKEHYKILLIALLTQPVFLFIGFIFIGLFKWGEMLPFLITFIRTRTELLKPRVRYD
ncbi:hypothetical protein J2X75_002242 [Paenibacillus sp. 2003]|nr:hypothetical protein [Paenibacillus sp. 2003]